MSKKRLRLRVGYTMSVVGEASITGNDVEQIVEAVENARNYPEILKHLIKHIDHEPYEIQVFDLVDDDENKVEIPNRYRSTVLNVNGVDLPPPADESKAGYTPTKVSFKCEVPVSAG